MDALSLFFASLDPVTIPLGGIVTFGVFGLLRGWLIPAPVMRERIRDKQDRIDALITERDNWQKAHQLGEEARHELVKQNGDLTDAAEATTRLLETMRNYIERMNPSQDLPKELGG